MRLALFAVLGTLLAATTAADFGVSEGFSGRHEATCLQCHQRAPGTPAATAHLDGLPDVWQPGQAYALTIRVTGGPAANPAPNTPDGGFDLEADAGTFTGDERLLKFPKPNEVTYEPDGTLQRTWQVTWTAPSEYDGPIGFWLAVVAANGNHVIGADHTGGQSGDATATLLRTVALAPSTATQSTPMPLAPMVVGLLVALTCRGRSWIRFK